MKVKPSPTARKYQEEFAKEYLAKKKAEESKKTGEDLINECGSGNPKHGTKKLGRGRGAKYIDPEKEKTKWMKDWEKW